MAASTTGSLKYWINGKSVSLLRESKNPGSQKYWLNGTAVNGVNPKATSVVKVRRRASTLISS